MTTECTTERLEFERFRRQRVVGRFDGGELGSDCVPAALGCCCGSWRSGRGCSGGVATKWWTLEGAAEGSNSVEGGTMVA